MKVVKNRILPGLVIIILMYLVLLIPDSIDKSAIHKAAGKPFIWNKDLLWKQLENDFRNARSLPAFQLDSAVRSLKTLAENRFSFIKDKRLSVTDSNLTILQNIFFSLAPLVAVKGDELSWYTDYYNKARNFIKLQSRYWDMQTNIVRDIMYGLLYGMRAAVEEVLLQTTNRNMPVAMMVQQERSVTPAARIFGIEVHSGDLLVSRGGAEVSALISRGNDYPGNFSHVALLFVDEKTHKPFVVEAHIERGVVISSVEEYEKDKKLRFMVMRPRSDLPVMITDPMLPQKAAKKIYDESLARHIPYDFKMNFYDSASMFCSEVASYAYRTYGLQIWQPVSIISSKGVENWLQDFGVENFVTQMPSDLEYDPQLAIVAEWREPATLLKDHIDNAVMDAMLELADKGKAIEYNTWKLPLARFIKGYCMIKNLFGQTGMIPEGMSATRALKNEFFTGMHIKIKKNTEQRVNEFINENHYCPPYWQLVEFARSVAKEN